MMNENFDKSIDLEKAKELVTEKKEKLEAAEKPEVVGSNWMDNIREESVTEETENVNETVTQEDNLFAASGVDHAEEIVTESVPEETQTYDGPGLVVTNEELEAVAPKTPKYTGVTPETQSNIDAYLEMMEREAEEIKPMYEERQAQLEIEENPNEDETDEDEESSTMTEDEFGRKYESAVVIIDKSGMGNVIDFTDEEREKLEKSRKIKLEEVETVSLESLKTKKMKKKTDLEKVIKRRANFNTTNIVLPISGYTAAVSGCSAYELISLIEPADTNTLLKMQGKWSIIHSKIESTSIGQLDFNDFLMNTATSDYETLLYGILCSTYPDDDSIELDCEKCGKSFKHNYSIRSLIRAEQMSEKLQNTIMEIVDSSVSESTAKETHANAPISTVKRVKLPVSEIIVELYVQTAYDLINKHINDLKNLTDSDKYKEAAILSTLIRRAFVYDESDDSYFELESGEELAKLVYSLSETDIMIIKQIGENLIDGETISYGLMGIKCPHCGHFIATVPVSLDDMLFHRYRQALNTTIE